jgi:7,8-dihydropterin-6-yl-methyl-4-(beta-D-ribofuranosyl)aminobenzene 5'-phosphate synthase
MSGRRGVALALTAAILAAVAPPALRAAPPPPARVTILVDAFGDSPKLAMDWGFAALVEYGGRRVLFDTGNDRENFARNVAALGARLTRLDAVVVSHRHGDHTSGLSHVLRLNPAVKVYVPDDEHFGGPTPPEFFRRAAASLPKHMRYFGGAPPAEVPHGTVWKGAHLVRVSEPVQIVPGFRVIRSGSPQLGAGVPEVSLSVETPAGQVMLVGCSHPGIEEMLKNASAPKQPVRLLLGGLHWVGLPEGEIAALAVRLRDQWKVREVAPGHCSGEPAFLALQKAFGKRYRYAGLGTVLRLAN